MESTSRTCRWVCRRLPLLAGGELAGLDRRRVERHLIGCSGCRSRHAASTQSLSLLREVAALSPSGVNAARAMTRDTPSVWPALARRIREAKHRPERSSVAEWVQSLAIPPLAHWVGSGLAASLILGLGWFWGANQASPTQMIAPTLVPITVMPAPPVPVVSTPNGDFEPLIAGNDQVRRFFEEFDAPAARFQRQRPALPQEVESRDVVSAARPGVDPFEPPLNLRLYYDLEYGTPAGPVVETQRAY